MCLPRYNKCSDRCRQRIAVLFCMVLAVLLFSRPVWAHKVIIFAWVEGDTVHTQSKFSGGRRAKNAPVLVYDKEGNQLLEGKTDQKGEFSFKVPKKTDLRIVLKASMGHMAEWKIPAEDIADALAGPEGKGEGGAATAPGGGESPSALVRSVVDRPVAVAGAGLDKAEIKALIDSALERQLAPVKRMLAESMDQGPRVSDVVGGLGYIFGLMGLAMYVKSRGKGK